MQSEGRDSQAIVHDGEWEMMVLTPEHAMFLYRENQYFRASPQRSLEVQYP